MRRSHIMVFEQNTDFQPFRDRLREYEYASKQVTTEYIDPDQQQTIARQNQVQQYGTLVITHKGRTERVTTNTEQDITNGIIKVVSGQQRKVYFTQGHGEKDPTSAERDGYGGIVDALKRENYLVEKTVLAQQGAVPDDASIVVIAGPKNDFLAPEIDALKKYLDKQGKLLLALDPPDSPTLHRSPILSRWRTTGAPMSATTSSWTSAGWVSSSAHRKAMPVAAGYPSHPITERFSVMTVYPLARSVTPVRAASTATPPRPVVQTSQQSWAEANLKAVFSQQPAKMVEAEGDKPGPVTIAAAVSAAAPPEPTRRRRPHRRHHRSPKPASWCLATPISRPTRISGSPATATC